MMKHSLTEHEEVKLVENLLPHIVPKYREAHDIITSMLDFQTSDEVRIADLGCGYGDLTRRIIDVFPLSMVFGIDNQPAILERTRAKFRDSKEQTVFFERDLSNAAWMNDLTELHAVVSSFTLDYLTVERHQQVVEEAFRILSPGGRWVSCEFFRSDDNRINRVFHDIEVSVIQGAIKAGHITNEQLQQLESSTILRREHHIVTVEEKMAWLRDAGFTLVDSPWRFLNLAVITGAKE